MAQIYICPMHLQVEQDGPGDCPICGMRLEPKAAPAASQDRESAVLSRKFWIGLVLSVPVFALALDTMIPVPGLRGIIPAQLSGRLQFLFATPVVLWSGSVFFVKAAKSLLNGSLNMFTLIAMGVGASYAFSVAAVFFPVIFAGALGKGSAAARPSRAWLTGFPRILSRRF